MVRSSQIRASLQSRNTVSSETPSALAVTFSGGKSNAGVVYQLNPDGQEKVLWEFTGGADGANPLWELIRDPEGNLYGATPNGGLAVYPGGCGVVFKVDPSGHETVLHTFTGGADGCGGGELARDPAGNLYGASNFGGSGGCPGFGCGVVFKLDPAGNETVLHNFTGAADGNFPGPLVRDSAGNLYGATYLGGPGGFTGGVVFKIDTLGNETTLHNFTGGSDGNNPRGITLDPAGNLYGTTAYGGTGSAGVVFKIDTSGNETLLHSFTGGADGGTPFTGVIRDEAGNLYVIR
jgi:uncharacterized repeat protein (TIGR03803 family)